jgi:hypothetical protein
MEAWLITMYTIFTGLLKEKTTGGQRNHPSTLEKGEKNGKNRQKEPFFPGISKILKPKKSQKSVVQS